MKPDMPILFDKFVTPDELKQYLEHVVRLNECFLSLSIFGYNAWHAAVLYHEFALEKIKILSQFDIDINSRDSRPIPGIFLNTPLHIAIANENSEVAYALIDYIGKKIDFSVMDKEQKTTLIFAAKINSDGIAIKILNTIPPEELASIVNMQDKDGMTALHYACLYGNRKLVDGLIKNGAKKDIKNKQGRIPFECTMVPIDVVKAVLNSVEIDPERDVKAIKNEIFDKNRICIYILDEDKASKVEKINEAVYPMPGIKSRKNYREGFEKDILQLPIVCSSSFNAYGRGRTEAFRCLTDDEKTFFLKQFDRFSGMKLIDGLEIKRQQLRDYFIKQHLATNWMLDKIAREGNSAGFFYKSTSTQMGASKKPLSKGF